MLIDLNEYRQKLIKERLLAAVKEGLEYADDQRAILRLMEVAAAIQTAESE